MANIIDLDCKMDLDEFVEGTSDGSNLTNDKSSFNRFDDNLVEIILSYLTFSEKVLFESVSKQWKKVIYNKQTELNLFTAEEEGTDTLLKLLIPLEIFDYTSGMASDYGYKVINKSSFKSILKKCKFIEKVRFDCYCVGEDLELIDKYCPLLKHLYCNCLGLSDKDLIDFGIKCGNKLQNIELTFDNYGNNYIKKFLINCKNLTNIYSHDICSLVCDDPEFLPNLKSLSLYLSPENSELLDIVSKKYSECMERLIVHSSNINAKRLISCVSQMKILNYLNMDFGYYNENKECNDDNFELLFSNCSQLKTLHLSIGGNGLNFDQLLYSFKDFSSLTYFDLFIYDYQKTVEGSIKCFNLCKTLKQFTIYCEQITEDFFDDIHNVLPNLIELDINFESEITDKLINFISNLKNLKKLYLRRSQSCHKLVTDQSICQLINSCADIEIISFNTRPNITNKTIETLISRAIQRPKTTLDFYCGLSANEDENELQEINLNNYLHLIPENLNINIVFNVWDD